MVAATRSLVGRDAELQALTGALDDCGRGRGALWLITGEPGIGKSRLCEEAARVAAERDVSVLWGRCWEAGGAPSYWPFIQVVRALLRARGPEASARLTAGRRAVLAELLPELLPELPAGQSPAVPAPTLEPEQARFRLLDTLTSLLCEAVASAPALIVLEDLHAADGSSVLLLDFLARQLPSARLLVLGTYREADVSGAVAEGLGRLRGQAHVRTLPLLRLGRSEVAALLEQILGRAPDSGSIDAVLQASEGNPLFVGEVARMHATAPGTTAAQLTAIPASLKTAIQQRLRTLSPEARRVVGLCSVLGRECRTAVLGAVAQRPSHALAAALDECAAAEVLLEVAPGQLRFSHILLQQVAYGELPGGEATRTHLAFADALEREGSAERASELAHHLLAAGPEAAARAVQATTAAARHALSQHAFAEAAAFFAQALEATPHAPQTAHAKRERCERLLELGRARMLAHELEAGRKACTDAAALARELDLPELFARAALAYGAVFVIGTATPTLMALLEEGLQRLGEGDHPLRASMMARLAAAMQPAVDPQPPIELARQAVAMARRLNDPVALRTTLRGACSAMIDLGDPVELHALCCEHAALAQEQGDLSDLFRAQLRLSVSAFEIGKVGEADTAIDSVERIAEQLRQPHYGWRAAALCAMRAGWRGRWAQAEALQEQALELGARAGDPATNSAVHMQRSSLLRLQGRYDDCLQALAGLRRSLIGLPMPLQAAAVYEAALLFRAGRSAQATALLSSAGTDARAWLFDGTMLEVVTEVCIGLGDRALAHELLAANASRADHFVSGGVMGMSWEAPVRVVLARLANMLGQIEQACSHYEQALAFLGAHGGRVHEAWVSAELAEACLAHGRTSRAHELQARAARLASELAIEPLAERMRALGEALAAVAGGVVASTRPAVATSVSSAATPGASAPAPRSVPDATCFTLQRHGEYFRVEHGSNSFSLRDSKGLALLSRLMQEPDRELHVLDLVASGAGVDGGDAGELIDSDARVAYQARVRALREQLEEAEGFGDLGRAERAREELEVISAELARAVGASGRTRRGGSAVERARVNVQRRLRDACERIREHDPELGRHLDWALRTGTFCSYRTR